MAQVFIDPGFVGLLDGVFYSLYNCERSMIIVLCCVRG